MTVEHYHTHDLVNGARYTLPNKAELERYLEGTGREMMRIRPCTDPSCGPQNPGDTDYGYYD